MAFYSAWITIASREVSLYYIRTLSAVSSAGLATCIYMCCGSSLTGDLPSAVWPAGLVRMCLCVAAPPWPVSYNFGDPMSMGTPGPQFHHYSGDPFVKLGTPLKRTRARSAQLFNCLQTTQLLSKGSSGHSENENIKRMACTSPLIHQSVSDGYFADWQHCQCRRLQRQ